MLCRDWQEPRVSERPTYSFGDVRTARTEPRLSEAVKKSGTDLSAVRQMPENAIARPGAAVCPVDFFTASEDSVHAAIQYVVHEQADSMAVLQVPSPR